MEVLNYMEEHNGKEHWILVWQYKFQTIIYMPAVQEMLFIGESALGFFSFSQLLDAYNVCFLRTFSWSSKYFKDSVWVW